MIRISRTMVYIQLMHLSMETQSICFDMCECDGRGSNSNPCIGTLLKSDAEHAPSLSKYPQGASIIAFSFLFFF